MTQLIAEGEKLRDDISSLIEVSTTVILKKIKSAVSKKIFHLAFRQAH
jgi:hypothetical protein